MICPVVDKGALSRPVYFPGGRWVDLWTGERIEDRQYKSFLTPIHLMPIFIREGAIIPKQPAMQWVDEKPVEEITFAVFPSDSSSFDFYEDDGISEDYKTGGYAVTHIDSKLNDGTWEMTVGKPEGSFRPAPHRYGVELWWDTRPTSVNVNGSELPEISADASAEGWYFDDTLRRVIIRSNQNNERQVVFQVR